jgi:alkaline phosphatase D
MSLGFGGAWFTTFGRLDLIDEAGAARGAYTHKGGRVEGQVEGLLLRGRWIEGAQSGPCALTLAPGGNAFHGTWSYDGEPAPRGAWTGARLALPSPAEGGFPGAVNALAEGPLLAGPMVGEVGERDAFLWAQARDASPLTLTVRGEGGQTLRQTAHPAWDDWLCVVFHVEGLTPGAAYEFTLESAPHGPTAPRRLRTAPPPDARRALVAFGSCFDDWDDGSLTIFDAIRRERPDVFLMIGDNCYYDEPDWQTQHTMMLAQLRNRCSRPLQPLLAEVPVLGIWDDHDYGPNDADGSFAEKADALPVFCRVFAQRAYGLPETPGIFSAVRLGPVEIFLTDDRWYREERRRILGEAQLGWLCRRLRESTAPVKLVVSGSQVLAQAAAGLDWECWHKDAPGELQALQAFLEEHDIQGVVFATGDVHLGYLLHQAGRALPGARRGPELWELTASPLANEPWYETVTGKDLYDPTLLAEHPVCNYGLVDVDLDRAGAEITLHLCDPRGERLVSQPLALASLRVRDEPPRLRAVLREGDQATFFTRDRFHLHDLTKNAPVPGHPRPITPSFRGLAPGGFDAAVTWPNGRTYFFKGNGYVAYDLGRGQALPGYPKYIASYWPGVWAEGVDAAVVWPTGKAYLFKGSEYLRYDVARDRVDEGYPRPIAEAWPGLWPEGVDAAVLWDDTRAYFFKGREVIAWSIAEDRVEEGYPRPTEALFPGVLGENGVG